MINETSVPKAVDPIYSHDFPNEPVTVYSGPIGLNHGSHEHKGNGSIVFDWSPTPGRYFSASLDIPGSLEPGELIALDTLDSDRRLRLEAKIDSMKWGGGDGVFLRGHITDRVREGKQVEQVELHRVIFHLPNIPHIYGKSIRRPNEDTGIPVSGRLEFSCDKWLICIDPIFSSREFKDSLQRLGGYGITYVGELKKKDDLGFTVAEAISVLNEFGLFISFAYAAWRYPILYVGFTENGERVWEESPKNRLGRLEPGKADWDVWFVKNKPEGLAEAYSCLRHTIQDHHQAEAIFRAIFWYIEISHPNFAAENSIILCQAALELLSWLLSKRSGESHDPTMFKGRISDCHRFLMDHLSLPLEIPTQYRALTSEALNRNWKDAPHALTEVRNMIVHPRHSDTLSSFPTQARADAMEMGRWLLELALLKVIGYNSTYSNRSARTYGYSSCWVPWHSENGC